MQFLLYLSDFMIPMVMFLIVGYGILMKVDIFDAFICGARDGIKMVFELMPTLIGLLMAIGIMRASGALELIAQLLAPFTSYFHQNCCHFLLLKCFLLRHLQGFY